MAFRALERRRQQRKAELERALGQEQLLFLPLLGEHAHVPLILVSIKFEERAKFIIELVILGLYITARAAMEVILVAMDHRIGSQRPFSDRHVSLVTMSVAVTKPLSNRLIVEA